MKRRRFLMSWQADKTKQEPTSNPAPTDLPASDTKQ
jgi:hypothetical protein